VSVASAGNIFSAGTVFNAQNSFGDQFTGVLMHKISIIFFCVNDYRLGTYGTNHVSAQNAVSLGVSQELDKTVTVVIGACSAVGLERELADFVFDLLLLELFFSVADPRNLRCSVDDGRNGHVIDVTDTAGQLFDNGNTW
jgi:hypothetical protein